MSLVTTVANVAVEQDARLVPEAPTRHVYNETRSSRELFEEYARSHADTLEEWGITSDNYIRKPNGKGDFEGVWQPPYPLDIWDYWVNYRFFGATTRRYISKDDARYIPHPDDLSLEAQMHEPAEGVTVYQRHLEYLWDFIYNPEVIMSRFELDAPDANRRRAFPVYLDNAGTRSDDGDIMPPYLPDATFPRAFSDLYPWAAWELEMPMESAQLQGDVLVPLQATRAQRQTYTRAHGKDKSVGEQNSDAYRFLPYDATEQLGKSVRPLYPIEKAALYRGYYAVPYSPLVMRDLSPFNSNGWIFCYRQAVRYSSDVYFPKNKLWDAFKEANRMLHKTPNMSIDYAVALALPRQRRAIWPTLNLSDFPVDTTFEIPADAVNTNAAIEMQLLRDISHRGRSLQDIYELATRVSGPVMERTPYKIITVQVYELEPLPRYLISFGSTLSWVLTVPPLLSVTDPLKLEYFTTDATIIWHTGVDEQQLTIMFDGEDVASSHQIRVIAAKRGESLLEAKVTRITRANLEPYRVVYSFELAWFALRLKTFELDHGLAGSMMDIDEELPGDGVYDWRQMANSVMYTYSDSPLAIERYISATWPRFDVDTRWTRAATQNFTVQVDFTQPVVMVRDTKNNGDFYIFIFKLSPVQHRVLYFGAQVKLVVRYDDEHHEMRWARPMGETDDQLTITVVSPRQLGRYTAEIRRRGRSGRPDYVVPFDVELVWESRIPLGYIQRSQYADWHLDNPAVEIKYVARETTDIQVVRSLRAEACESVFFRAMIRAWAFNYFLDLENYARCFPYVLKYCELMDKLSQLMDVSVVSVLDGNVKEFLPEYMSEPVLQLRLYAQNSEATNASVAYVVFDPLYGKWINVFALEHKEVDDSWLSRGHDHLEGLYTQIKSVFPHVSIELEERRRRSVRKPSLRWEAVRERQEKVTREFEKMRASHRLLSNSLGTSMQSTQHQLETSARTFSSQTIGEISQRLTVELMEDFDREVENMRLYARFVSMVVTACLSHRFDVNMTWTVTGVTVLVVLGKNVPGFAESWPTFIKTFGLQRLNVFSCAALRNKDGSLYLLEEMRADNYPMNSKYVVFKFLRFVCMHDLVAIDEAVKKVVVATCNRQLDVLQKSKMTVLSENY